MKFLVGAILLNLCGLVTALTADTISLSQLQPGDRLHIDYYSRGCFHERKYEIDFERDASVTARSSGHIIALSAPEVTGLDKLIRFYRSRPSGGCTTEDKITISHFHGLRNTSTEQYIDGSCATYDMKDVTRLDDIAKKLHLERDS